MQGGTSDDVRISVPDHVVFRAFEAETLMLNLETGQYHGLNATGARMLELVREGLGFGDAVERLAAEFDTTPDAIRGDLSEFCRQLAERGLIELEAES